MITLEIDWAWGGMMTAWGMGTVFALLALLFFTLWGIGVLDQRRQTALEAKSAKAAALVAAPAVADRTAAASDGEAGEAAPSVTMTNTDGLDDDTLAAIAVAVIKHAEIRRKQAAPESRPNAPGSQLFASRWVTAGRTLQNSPFTRR